MPWAPGPRQELVDTLAEADLAHRLAETRDLEDKTARENRREEAEISFLEAQTRKVTGEVAQQPLEAEERRARIEESEARTARIWFLLLMTGLLAAISLILGAVDSGALVGNGFDLLGEKVWVLPTLSEGG